ncbi:MAG TPA: MFS transporter, partial [Stellaceae bacterium]|nr:MFS transporter [Stellaceae bacterium]
MISRGAAAATPGQAWPETRTAWYAVAVFTLALTFNQIDANSVSLLVTPIKRDLHLSEFQVSLLQGFALVPFYLFVGIPLSRFVDWTSRKHMLAAAIGFWSLATAGCGVAQGFWQLFLARFLIGAGESVNGPATYSMLADYFPPARLPRAIGVLQLGFIGGNALSFMGGGVALGFLATLPDYAVPVIGTIHNWQLLFLFAGLPGLIVALLLLTLVEPPRRDRGAPPIRNALREWGEVFGFLGGKWQVFVPMFVGLGLSSISLFGTNQWLFTFFIRTYHWTPQQIGPALGTVQFFASLLGVLIGLAINHRFHAQGRDDTNLRVLILAQLIRVPVAIATPLMPD